jgi:RNA polymerase sigma-70 factor (ECF subfamily)
MIQLKTERAFTDLYASHAGGVRRFLRGMLGGNTQQAEELTQEAFLKAWRALPTFAFKSTMKTWVYTVALNTARDWLRGHGGRRFEALSPTMPADVHAETPETRAVREALLELDENTRALLMLHYYEDMGLAEIGQVLKVPEGTVKSRLHHAKSKLRPKLIAKGFDV